MPRGHQIESSRRAVVDRQVNAGTQIVIPAEAGISLHFFPEFTFSGPSRAALQ